MICTTAYMRKTYYNKEILNYISTCMLICCIYKFIETAFLMYQCHINLKSNEYSKIWTSLSF